MIIKEPFIEVLHGCPSALSTCLSQDELWKLKERSECAKSIVDFIGRGENPECCYRSLAKIMKEQPRIALYLPFGLLKEAPANFRECYIDAWRECWAYHDIREAFNLGDIYEKTASVGEPERIVKAMHLVPWLIEYEYITVGDALTIMRFMKDYDPILCWSLRDAATFMHYNGQISESEYREFTSILLPNRPKPPILEYETEVRRSWLAAKAHNYNVGTGFELRNPIGPFGQNVDIGKIAHMMPSKKGKYTILIGSYLKGYSRNDSDCDAFTYDPITGSIEGFEAYADKPSMIITLVMNGAWIGEDEQSTSLAQYYAARRCFDVDEEEHRRCLLKMEADLLQFRLMHKGYRCAHPEEFKKDGTSPIDVNSAFYKDGYRKIATQLFAKYVVLPRNQK